MPESSNEYSHVSILAPELIEALAAKDGGLYIDATVGLGGHSEMLLNASEASRVVGIDQDEAALDIAKERLARFGGRVSFIHGNFEDIGEVLKGEKAPDGIIADLGVSSMQLDDGERGFSFRDDAPLDMRMDRSQVITAAELLATMTETEIADTIYKYGEERASRKIARWIVNRRNEGRPVETTSDLSDLVRRAIGQKRGERIHPATKTFQALRIAVNRELEVIERFIEDAVTLLRSGGRLAIISFHSLEDRIVKRHFQRLSGRCECPPRQPQCTCGAEKLVEILTRKPIVPSEDEQAINPRSRSAKLRVCRKL
jgi:16S rRNA (cytosine1402-N4)-methyltransferase